eukprot:TRINITY_DN2651_c0_g1_i1.p1 TRINITY_DN2651_c0_g1~~TRINITY_DN2651_c0_g1_i1.p1  ORF type:complete len:233 (-),score=25.21 TRINITY_DN2651_c0_g1_i1:113-811(-)
MLAMSARPRQLEFFLGLGANDSIPVNAERVGQVNGYPFWGVNTAESLYGDLKDGYDFRLMGYTKGENFLNYAGSRTNEYFTFLGDNGQGDACAGQMILESQYSDRVPAVFIHEVQSPDAELKTCQGPDGLFELTLRNHSKAFYHQNYAAATLWALKRNIISHLGAQIVVDGVSEWINCRCDGQCVNFVFTGTANQYQGARVDYCDQLKTDVATLIQSLPFRQEDGYVRTLDY